MIFEPTDNPMLDEYPELGKYAEFKNLPENHLRLGYFYACKSSPYSGLEEHKRIGSIIKREKLSLTEYEKRKFAELEFGEELENSFTQWAKFIPEIRTAGYNAMFNIMKNCVSVAKMDISKYSETEFSELKSLISCQIEIGKNMPDIVLQVEQGFGVTKKQRRVEESSRLTEAEIAME